jgi:histone-lysine N-methyltransferase SETMAR
MNTALQITSNWPLEITFENTNSEIDRSLPPKDFIYISTSIYPEDLYTNTNGCSCPQGECSIATCSCIQANSMGEVFDACGRLLPLLHNIDFQDSLSECGPHCSCSGQCKNSPSLNSSLKYPITLRSTPNKGISAFAAAKISLGSFVCTYSGELLRREDASTRLRQYDSQNHGHALLVLREILPSGSAALRTHIDATVKGNVARFFNHRCGGGNLELLTSRSPGSLIPKVCLFANRDIHIGEELTFAYGLPNDGTVDVSKNTPLASRQHLVRCFCGSEECLGFLPHQGV